MIHLTVFDPNASAERRYKILWLDLDLFVNVFIPAPFGTWFRCYEGLPEGARFVTAEYEAVARRMRLLVEHESFPPIPEGGVAPIIGASFMSWSIPEDGAALAAPPVQ